MALQLNSDIRKKLGQKLREIREKRRFSQDEVAKACGISVTYYAGIERGEENPTLAVIESLCKVLKVKSSDILPF